jgi:hypothetical protein
MSFERSPVMVLGIRFTFLCKLGHFSDVSPAFVVSRQYYLVAQFMAEV